MPHHNNYTIAYIIIYFCFLFTVTYYVSSILVFDIFLSISRFCVNISLYSLIRSRDLLQYIRSCYVVTLPSGSRDLLQYIRRCYLVTWPSGSRDLLQYIRWCDLVTWPSGSRDLLQYIRWCDLVTWPSGCRDLSQYINKFLINSQLGLFHKTSIHTIKYIYQDDLKIVMTCLKICSWHSNIYLNTCHCQNIICIHLLFYDLLILYSSYILSCCHMSCNTMMKAYGLI